MGCADHSGWGVLSGVFWCVWEMTGTLSLPLALCFEVSTLEVYQGEVETGACLILLPGGPPWTSLTA